MNVWTILCSVVLGWGDTASADACWASEWQPQGCSSIVVAVVLLPHIEGRADGRGYFLCWRIALAYGVLGDSVTELAYPLPLFFVRGDHPSSTSAVSVAGSNLLRVVQGFGCVQLQVRYPVLVDQEAGRPSDEWRLGSRSSLAEPLPRPRNAIARGFQGPLQRGPSLSPEPFCGYRG